MNKDEKSLEEGEKYLSEIIRNTDIFFPAEEKAAGGQQWIRKWWILLHLQFKQRLDGHL